MGFIIVMAKAAVFALWAWWGINTLIGLTPPLWILAAIFGVLTIFFEEIILGGLIILTVCVVIKLYTPDILDRLLPTVKGII